MVVTIAVSSCLQRKGSGVQKIKQQWESESMSSLHEDAEALPSLQGAMPGRDVRVSLGTKSHANRLTGCAGKAPSELTEESLHTRAQAHPEHRTCCCTKLLGTFSSASAPQPPAFLTCVLCWHCFYLHLQITFRAQWPFRAKLDFWISKFLSNTEPFHKFIADY